MANFLVNNRASILSENLPLHIVAKNAAAPSDRIQILQSISGRYALRICQTIEINIGIKELSLPGLSAFILKFSDEN